MKQTIIALALAALSIYLGFTIEPSVPVAGEGDPQHHRGASSEQSERG